MSKMGNVVDLVLKYNELKNSVLPLASSKDVAHNAQNEIRKIRDGLWNSFANIEPDGVVSFNSPQEIAGVISILLDTGKIFGIRWKRKTTSKSKPAKVAGSIDTLTVKKVSGYVKGTSGGKKHLEDVQKGRVTLWVANGGLQDEGFGNWRTIYAKDIQGSCLGGVCVGFELA